MTRPPFEVADMIRAGGNSFFDRSRKWLTWLHEKCSPPSCAAARLRSAAMSTVLALRTPRHLLQLLPQPALPQVPGQCARPLARGRSRNCFRPATPMSSSRSPMSSRRWPCRTKARSTASVSRQRRDAARGCARPASTSAQRSASSASCTPGTDTTPPSAYPLRGSGRRTGARSHALDPPALPFLLPVKVLSRVFRGKFVAGLRALPRMANSAFTGSLHPHTRRRSRLCALCFAPTGSSIPTVLRRPRTCAALSGLLHPSRRHLQSPARVAGRRQVTFRWRDSAHHEQAAPDDTARRRVPAPLSTPRAATRLPPYPPLRLPRPPAARRPPAACFALLGRDGRR